MKVSYGCLVNDIDKLNKYLLQSKIKNSLYFVWNADSATKGLNKLLKTFGDADIGVIVHQDVILPENWEEIMLMRINDLPDNWGVAGCWGRTADCEYHGSVLDRDIPCMTNDLPCAVDTLDELCLIINMKAQPLFNEKITGWDLYGTYISLFMKEKGMEAFAIDAPCIHKADRGWKFEVTPAYVDNLMFLDLLFPKRVILSTVFPDSGGSL
jgi:hypothetical protein